MKNVTRIFSKPKYYIVFPVLVAALFGTSLINVPCPVCGGTGALSQSVGMQDVRVVSVESRILSSQQDACTAYIITRAHPIINVNNISTETTASGYLVLHLVDTSSGETVASQDLAIEAAPNTVTILDSEIYFGYNTGDTPPENLEIQVEVLLTNVVCIACNGTGHVSLTAYPLTHSYKNAFISNILSEQPFDSGEWVNINGQNVQVGSKPWLDWMELS